MHSGFKISHQVVEVDCQPLGVVSEEHAACAACWMGQLGVRIWVAPFLVQGLPGDHHIVAI